MGFLGDLHVYHSIFLYTGKQWNEIHEYDPPPPHHCGYMITTLPKKYRGPSHIY